MPIAGVFATGAVLVAAIWISILVQQSPKLPFSAPRQTMVTLPGNAPTSSPSGAGKIAVGSKPETKSGTIQLRDVLVPFQEDGGTLRNLVSVGGPLALAVGALFYWFNLPRIIEEAKDAHTFTTALEAYSEQIFLKYDSPREARRFLNYLRLVATTSGQGERDTLKNLRNRYPERFDRGLVGLAVAGANGIEAPSEVKQYYSEQCELFGLDGKTFQPKENDAVQKQPAVK